MDFYRRLGDKMSDVSKMTLLLIFNISPKMSLATAVTTTAIAILRPLSLTIQRITDKYHRRL
jgi:hypothetical protein